MKLKTGFIALIGVALMATMAKTAAFDSQLELANRYSNQVFQYLQQGQFQQALPLAKQAFSIFTSKLGKTHQKTLIAQGDLALIYNELGNHEKALPLAETAYNTSKKALGERHQVTLVTRTFLVKIYLTSGRFQDALPLSKKSYRLSKELSGEQNPGTLTSLNNLAAIYQNLGRYDEALPLFKKGYRLSKKFLGEQHPMTVMSVNNLAAIYQKQGRYNEALPLSKKGYRLSKEVFGEQHPQTLLIFNNLAMSYQNLGRYDEALPLLKKGYRLSKEVLGEQHRQTVLILNNLAMTYQNLGRDDEGLPLFKKGYRLSKEVLGEQHHQTVLILNNLALTYQNLGRYDEGLPLFKKGYRLSKEVLGEQHPQTVLILNNLAVIYQNLGRYDDALPLSEKGYRLSKEVSGEQHPETLASLISLVTAYLQMGRYDDALPLSEKGYRLSKEVLGEQHPQTLASLNNLAMTYQNLGRYDEALPLSEKCYRLSKEVLGEQHPKTLIRLDNLAGIYQDSGRLSNALPLSEKVFSLRKDMLGEKHPDTLISLNNLALTYQDMGRYDDALPLFEKGYRLSKEVLGEQHPKTLTHLSNVALNYQKLGRLSEALPLSEKVFSLRKDVLGEKHPDTIASLDYLGQIYDYLGIFNIALLLSEKGYFLKKNVLGEKHPDTLASMNNLARIYRNLGRFSETLSLIEKSFSLKKELLGEKHPETLISLHNLAITYAELGRIQQAIKLLETFVAGVESLRKADYLSAENRQTWFQKWLSSYTRLLMLYLNQSREQDAFRLAEMTKARTLLDSMALKFAVQQAGLTESEQQQFKDYSRQLNRFHKQIAETAELDKRLALERQKNQVVKQLADFQRLLKKKYPKFQQLVETQIISAVDGAKLLPSKALFISYLMPTNDRIIVFTLAANGELQAHDLGQIAGLQQTLETYRVLLGSPCTVKQLRRACGRQSVWQLNDGSFVISRTKPENAKKRISHLDEISRYLGNKLLAPLKQRLASQPRWIISPDGALALIPFDTLIIDQAPVIQAHAISYVQSLSVLAMLKQREQEYRQNQYQGMLLAMGNARYELPETHQSTAPASTASEPEIQALLSRGASDPQRYRKIFKAKGEKWKNLAGSQKELAALKQLFANGQPRIYQQAQASEANLQRLNREQVLKDYRYLVFAAHGYFDAQIPELSVLVLDQLDKTPGTDGYITASEWVGYTLRSDLMVLSACQTGLGKLMRGEGVMGLPYALYVAGNKNTLMTLWNVDDKGTAEFSQRFFSKLKQGMNQVSALTETKREFWQSQQYKRPLFWAPFVLYGI
jgi:tetratricopeptide (TPR) repeat protein